MEIELNEEQRKAIEALKWLYMGQRGSGRSTALALAYIDIALETRQKVRIHDHHNEIRADRYLADIIQKIVDENEIPLKVNPHTLTLHTP